MTGDTFGKVTPGSPLKFPAEVYNRLVEVARGVDLDKSGRAKDLFRQTNIIKIRNDSAEAVGLYGVLGLDVPLVLPEDGIDEFKSKVAFSGVTPTLDHFGKFAILLEPLAVGAIGRAAVGGVIQVRISVDENDLHDFAEVLPGDTTRLIGAAEGSVSILWTDEEGYESSADERWAIVRFDGGNRQTLYPLKYHCVDGVFKEYEVRPAGEVYQRDVACCDPSCATGSGITSGSGLLDSDECCANYPAKICLRVADLSTTDADLRNQFITLDWMDSLPANYVGNFLGEQGYYGTATFNGHAFEWWFVRRSLCTFVWAAEKDNSSVSVGGTGEATLFLGPITERRGSWTCAPFTMTVKDYSDSIVATATTGECSSSGGSGFGNGIPTACCPTANTPNLLTASITSKGGWMTCFQSSVNLVYNDNSGLGLATPAWYTQIDPCCTQSASLRLRCDGTASGWKLAVVDQSGNILVPEASFLMGALTCDPFEVHFVADSGTSNTCQPGQAGIATIVITE